MKNKNKVNNLPNRKNKSMLKFKDGQTQEQVIEKLVRDYLLRCYSNISKQYLPIAEMTHISPVFTFILYTSNILASLLFS